ncbi:sel1 repeat family protein [Pseudomonas chlororaphis]|uniref:Sel1 repeat family protein n=1 Tax=Pseudomonas chlororaphis subsp. aurantiaca TaxID=86192 RepID=A0AAJ0ZN51_9PSED|nr:lipoprotein, putative [Pseudomonas chlororaphis subsp. aurantiaca]MBU4635875.1 sel1 repeat family protein [Pseudomonas chlororaphis subsp. aurantiaca]QQX59905.1 sel1 repeat family protein [Pseudomonas chlororaphis subsp. aurantiaca]UVE46646.1 sel1 repeat family protein [Pseudomonas chlororaphis]
MRLFIQSQIREYPLKLFNVLPLALAVLLAACATTAPEKTEPKIPELNDTLPKLTLESVLPKVSANEYCNPAMDADVLYGAGYKLYEAEDFKSAKSCFAMAAPNYTRAFCYLSTSTDQETDRPKAERDRESFNYIAYSAAQNDWCAEYGMYATYWFGDKDIPQDKHLAVRWLERSALHGNPEPQQSLADAAEESGDLVKAYAWLKVIDNTEDTSQLDALKGKMSPEQLAEGEQRFSELKARVTSKQVMYDEARAEEVAIFSAEIHFDIPDLFKGMTTAERQAFVKAAIAKARDSGKFKLHYAVTQYIIVSRLAQQRYPGVDVLQNPKLVVAINHVDDGLEATAKKSLAIMQKSYK